MDVKNVLRISCLAVVCDLSRGSMLKQNYFKEF